MNVSHTRILPGSFMKNRLSRHLISAAVLTVPKPSFCFPKTGSNQGGGVPQRLTSAGIRQCSAAIRGYPRDRE